MRKGSGADTVKNYYRIPRPTYAKLVADKEQTKCRSINKKICLILDEYFQMKEAEETQKQTVVS